MSTPTVRIFVESRPYEVEAGQNLLSACLTLGFDLPYFCWHPALHSVGACRQCAVKQFRNENDAKGRIVMACMTPAADGVRISIDDPEAHAFRAAVIEWLMLNHPHDCPVCDEGGECHLQDMTVMTGHWRRRYRGKKRTFYNQDLGPFVGHEMNRCIQCYRCVRFYRDYAGGGDLAAFSLRSQVFFGRHRSGVLESGFSGNLVEVCPTGVFTDKSLKRHYTRKWDLETAPSVCVHCALGCNTIPGARYGTLRRISNRFNGKVNGYFLCDRGRFGYEFVNSASRLRSPLMRGVGGGPAAPLSDKTALNRLEEIIAGSRGIAGIGSPRASLEANFALRRLAGPDLFFSGLSGQEQALAQKALSVLKAGPARCVSLKEVRESDAVLVLGEDVTNFAPLLDLALRQSVRQKPTRELGGVIPAWDDTAMREATRHQGPLFIVTPAPTRLDGISTSACRAAPDEVARLGFAVASLVDGKAPAPLAVDGEARRLADAIARALEEAERPLVIAGTGLGSEAVMEAAANVAWALSTAGRPAGLCLALPEANSMGAALMEGGPLTQAVAAVESGEADTVVILENNLYRRAVPALVDKLFTARNVIAIDYLDNAMMARAGMVLPAATFAESDGTLVNSEGRAQRFFKVMPPEGGVKESWRWIEAMAVAAGALEKPWGTIGSLIRQMSEEVPALDAAGEAAPGDGFRLHDQKVARQSRGFSGRTAMRADVNVREDRPPGDRDSPLTFSMEGFQDRPPAPLVPRYWSPGWNSVQALNKFQEEVGGPLRGGDPGRRLIEPAPGPPAYFNQPPAPFARRRGLWLLAPLYHIFGSEELSVFSLGVRQLAPASYLALNHADAAGLGVPARGLAELETEAGFLRLPVRLIDSLPDGVCAVPVCLEGLEGAVSRGEYVRLRAAPEE